MSEYELSADILEEADQKDLVGFSCGDTDYGRASTQWITGSDVFDSIKRGTNVWLYRNQAGDVIGFGSIGPIRWRWPLPDGSYTNLLIIPMLGIDERYHGQPPDVQWRYSHQILNHLIYEARSPASESSHPIEWLLLMVHPDNQRAIRLYEQFDFKLIPDVTRGAGYVVMKHRLNDAED